MLLGTLPLGTQQKLSLENTRSAIPTTLSLVNIHCCEQVVAIPEYYSSIAMNVEGGCTVPKKGYDGHGNPVLNAQITFTLEDSKGERVTTWDAGEVYHLTIAKETGEEMQAIVVATIGILNITHEAPSKYTVGFQVEQCENAWGSLERHLNHTIRWDPPADLPSGGMCVVFSAALASGSHSAYQVNSVRLLHIVATISQ